MKAYIVRIWRNREGQIGGHVSDPETKVRSPFRDAEELWQLLVAGNGLAPRRPAPAPPESPESGANQ